MYLMAMWGDAVWSRAISRLTDGGPSHVAIGFNARPDSDELGLVYFEALFGRGVIGPRPVQRLLDWQERRPKTRRMEIVPLPCEGDVAFRKRMAAEMWVGAAGYGHLQIIAMLLRKKFGFRVRRNLGRVVCSEFVARLLWPEYDLRDGREFDAVTPANVLRAARELAAEEGI